MSSSEYDMSSDEEGQEYPDDFIGFGGSKRQKRSFSKKRGGFTSDGPAQFVPASSSLSASTSDATTTSRNEGISEKTTIKNTGTTDSSSSGIAIESQPTGWMKHTKGIGLKYLQKFGFKGGGLGAKGEGITKPIEAVVHGHKKGLGSGTTSSESVVKKEPVQRKENYSKIQGIGEPLPGKGKSTTVKKRQGQGQGYGTSFNKYEVVDLRGSFEKPFKEEKLIGEEFTYNLDLISGKVNEQSTQIQNQYDDFILKKKRVEQEIERLRKTQAEVEEKMQSMSPLLEIMNRIVDKLNSEPENITLLSINKTIISLYEGFPDEFKAFGVIGILYSMLNSVINRGGALGEEGGQNFGVYIDIIKKGEDLLDYFLAKDEDALYTSTQEILSALICGQIIPCIQKMFQCNLLKQVPEKLEESDKMAFIIVQIRDLVDSVIVKDLLEHYVAPFLRNLIMNFVFGIESTLYRILTPWLHLIDLKVHGLHMVILSKLSNSLQNIQLLDNQNNINEKYKSFVLTEIRPFTLSWNFKEINFSNQLLGKVIPQLIEFLRNVPFQFHGNEILETIFVWNEIIPDIHIIALIEGEYFPKWIVSLGIMILQQENTTMDENLREFYKKLKNALPSKSIERSSRIRLFLYLALQMIRNVQCIKSKHGLRGKELKFENYFSVVRALYN